MHWPKLPDQKKPLAPQTRAGSCRSYQLGQRQSWRQAARLAETMPLTLPVEPEENSRMPGSDGAI